MKFGHRAKQYGDLLDMYKKTRAEGFGDEVKRRIMIGTYVLSHGYYDAYYLQAQKIRRMIADDFQQAFKQCDVIAGPVAPTVAWKLGEHGDDPLADYLADIFTLPGSLAGLPGMSVPCGFGAGGMPVGLQLIGNYFQEGAAAERGAPLPAGHRFPPPQAGGLLMIDRRKLDSRATKSSSASRPTPSCPRRARSSAARPRPSAPSPTRRPAPVDLALPGTLPVMNKGAVERAISFGLAVGAHIAPRSIFARKNYFYPDLPKGYQISQYEIPVVQGGSVEFYLGDEKKSVRLVRAHLEEDAGKSLHEDFVGQSGIDLNRAGTPLLEIVTEPDMRSSDEAVAYAKELHKIVTWIGICDGNMQEGSFRCDANVSVRKPGAAAGHAARDQEPEQLQVHAAGDRLRDPLADRADRGRPRRSSRPPCCSTPTPARRAPCAPRKTRPTTATSPTRTCRRW